ncbi:hypothetical protein LGN04_27320 [Burkholderia multivorans]|uniref:hypothetical protein n=1 Tax=Burkholderia multivorans TaxID=87883 RepID=UPI001B92A984|nr:hypothetical protein [Burkholderia multivorans]MBR7922003.1 hypothetical protein [Burkholderia multivorans]MBU9184919.1 hypothetical protein [Burkholderia multivorans]MCA7956536.1 hypothetical protein [Burkholderia multivorans]MCA8457616.1 hypothetical protein [Burkholderia multivorans]
MISRRTMIAMLPALAVLPACKPKEVCQKLDNGVVDQLFGFAGKVTPFPGMASVRIFPQTVAQIRVLVLAIGKTQSSTLREIVAKAVAADIANHNFVQVSDASITQTEFLLMLLASNAISREVVTSKC